MQDALSIFTVVNMSETSETPQSQHPGDPSAERVATDLSAVVGRLLRRLRSSSADSLLTPSQRSVLARLEDGGPATTAALARAELVRPQSMRLTLGALESQGFVARAPDPEDGRKSVVSVTEEEAPRWRACGPPSGAGSPTRSPQSWTARSAARSPRPSRSSAALVDK